MTRLTVDQILPIETFVAQRTALQAEVLANKSVRRLTVAGHLTFLFENHMSMWWQVQEMCRVEGIRSEQGVAHEVGTYGPLASRPDAISATLLIEYPDPAERDAALARLLGLQDHVHLELEGRPRITAVFDTDQFNETRLSSVQFIAFPITEADREVLGSLAKGARLVVDHPALSTAVALPGTLRAALLEDTSDS